jgi:hypothetical protein
MGKLAAEQADEVEKCEKSLFSNPQVAWEKFDLSSTAN